MNASPEPHELFGYRYILSTTTSWCAENPIVLEIKIPQITRNAPASMYKRLVNMICLHFSLIEMYFSVNQDSEHCLKLLYIKKRKASKSTKKQLTTKSQRFYDSLPFGYSIDIIGSGLVDRNIEKDAYESKYQVDAVTRVKKYLMQNNESLKDLFGSVRASSNVRGEYDRPESALTVGVGYGRFIEATSLAKAVRIEEFLIGEGELRDHLPKEAILELSKIINRENEYQDRYGEAYEKEWYHDMEAIMQESSLLKENTLGAIGILRIEEVLEREDIADRFYGWDVTLGSKFDITTPYTDQDSPPVNLDVSASYARPISWRWQVSERVSINTPFDGLGKAYSSSLSSDISYELSNRVDLRLRHLLRLEKPEAQDAEAGNSFALSFVYYIENYLNLVVTEQIDKGPEDDLATNFTVVLNYRVF